MNPATVLLPDDELDRRVAAYEAAWAVAPADLARFLPDRADPHFPQVLAELVRVDLELRSGRGESPRLDSYRGHAPELFADPNWVHDLAFEEYRQRLDGGEPVRPAEYAARYGIDTADWPAAADAPAPAFPAVGETVGPFRLLRELGRGSFGRVFLAEQTDLAGRRVAVKFSTRFGRTEPETLARLQHTHIVPIYATHPHGRSQVIVMPYLGGTTLADVLAALRAQQPRPAAGTVLADTIADRTGRTKLLDDRPAEPDPAPRPSVPLDQLRKLSYPAAVLWIGWKLAEALAHAHDRGVLHRDVKPANVLLTDEGRPMLLDFNLAGDAAGGGPDLGGTPAYMAPEQLAAMKAGRGTIDGRADVYSLGLVLTELLVGRVPGKDGPRIRERNPAVSPSTEAILLKCLAADPAARYATARELADELHRQLTDQPLAATREPSVRERFGKWRRRHPLLASTGSVAVAAVAAVLALGFAVVARQRHVERLTEERAAAAQFGDFQRAVPGVLDRVAAHDGRAAGARLDALLARYGVLDRADWADRRDVARLPADDRRELIDQVGELLLLKARRESDPAWADRAEAAYRRNGDVPRAVWEDRYNIATKLGRDARAFHDRAKAAPARGRDWYLSGLAAHAEYQFEEAAAAFEKAVAADPRHYWSWLFLGDVRTKLGRDDAAEACFTACIALRPDLAAGHFNRGLCRHRRRQFDAAVRDLTAALDREFDPARARIVRGIAYQDWGKWAEAEADFTAAVAAGTEETRVYFRRADVRAARGDAAGAAADRAEGLRRQPADAVSWVTRGLARAAAGDFPGAVADYDAALKLDPRSYDAHMNKANVLDEKLHREADAIRVLGELLRHNPAAATARAGRAVLLARTGDRAAAVADAEYLLARNPDPLTRYQLAGAYAQTAKLHAEDVRPALALLRSALNDGFGLEFVDSDPDLAPLRGRADFRKVVEAARTLRPSKE
jgi:serine/threonine protein kinase/Tfp pilus assembly protein PilF